MNTDGTGFHTCEECHKTESLWNRTATDRKDGEQLEDQRSDGESSCNCGDGTDRSVQSLMFMVMLGAFSLVLKRRPLPVSRLSVCRRVSAGIPLDGYLSNFVLGWNSMKSVDTNQIWSKSGAGKRNWHFTWRTGKIHSPWKLSARVEW